VAIRLADRSHLLRLAVALAIVVCCAVTNFFSATRLVRCCRFFSWWRVPSWKMSGRWPAKRRRDWSAASDAYWVYAAKRLRVEGVGTLPKPTTLRSGTLLVTEAERRALTKRKIAGLRAIGRQTKSAGTLRIYRGRGGRPLVCSVCVGCRAVVSPGGSRREPRRMASGLRGGAMPPGHREVGGGPGGGSP
jgi:hypothetical protein